MAFRCVKLENLGRIENTTHLWALSQNSGFNVIVIDFRYYAVICPGSEYHWHWRAANLLNTPLADEVRLQSAIFLSRSATVRHSSKAWS